LADCGVAARSSVGHVPMYAPSLLTHAPYTRPKSRRQTLLCFAKRWLRHLALLERLLNAVLARPSFRRSAEIWAGWIRGSA